jgi:hypothetical protein
MDTHPFTMHDIARARSEERLLRGLAAYHALRVRDERSAESVSAGSGGRLRILDRLRRRDVRVTGSTA